MLGIGEGELLIIVVFAFLLFGPDKLPQMGRTIGRALRQFRETQEKMTSVVQTEVIDPMTAAAQAPKPKKPAAVAAAEDAEWKRTDPETRNRTSGMLAQLEAAIAGLEDDLARAEASGDEKRIAEARTALEARRAWYDQVSRTAEQLG